MHGAGSLFAAYLESQHAVFRKSRSLGERCDLHQVDFIAALPQTEPSLLAAKGIKQIALAQLLKNFSKIGRRRSQVLGNRPIQYCIAWRLRSHVDECLNGV